MNPYPTSRRQFLVTMAATLAAGCTSGSAPARPTTTASGTSGTAEATAASAAPTTAPATTTIVERRPVPDADVAAEAFSVGVASGSPLPDGFVIWTRLVGVASDEVTGVWEVADDPAFEVLAATGEFVARSEFDHSVHVEVSGLAAGGRYWYRFLAGPAASPTGATRTAPTDPTEVRLGVSSCQLFESGRYAAHRHMASFDLDAVVWLGDFIYEYVTGAEIEGRAHSTDTARTLDGYRSRYTQYRSDPHLQANSASHPWIMTWDDHEVDNDYGPDVDPDRRAAAYQAWWENTPVRLEPPTAAGLTVYGSTRFGGLVNLVVPDCRQYATDDSILGADQFAWLDAELARPSRWTVLASSVLVSGTGLDLDSGDLAYTWSGHPDDRRRLAAALTATTNPLIVSGDLHTAMDLDFLVGYDLGEESAARELMAPAISSPFRDDLVDLVPLLPLVSPTINYAQPTNGWLELAFTAAECRPTFWFVDDVADGDSGVTPTERPPLTAH